MCCNPFITWEAFHPRLSGSEYFGPPIITSLTSQQNYRVGEPGNEANLRGHGYAFWNILRDYASGCNRAGRWPIEIFRMG